MNATNDTSHIAIEAVGLRKRFGDALAVDGVDLTVRRGSVFGLLGQNGAGKTTIVRMLTTLLRPDEGHAIVAGFDVQAHPNEVRRRIGLVGQYASVDELLTGRQNLWMLGRLYGLSSREAKRRADELLHAFDLVDAAERIAKTYSGGMRRRLDLAASLVLTPPVLFLDEPTTGLDPKSRAAVWDMVGRMTKDGTTVMLTTQYLEEADRFADRVAVMHHGKVAAHGTPAELKAQVKQASLVVRVSERLSVEAAVAVSAGFTARAPKVTSDSVQVLLEDLSQGTRLLEAFSRAGAALDDVTLTQATMDDVFLALTATSVTERKVA